jgi:hypothetical protein
MAFVPAMYTPYYCEENIWYLCQTHQFKTRDATVVFISNHGRTVALARQTAGSPPDGIVVWDYHVVLLTSEPSPLIWDLDTTVGCPSPASQWYETTFGAFQDLPDPFRPRFYLTPAEHYVAAFSSDRRHMRDKSGQWRKPAPPWPCIGQGHNLTEWYSEPGGDVNRSSLSQLKFRELLDP